jgi:hypothetical protein
MKHLFHALGIIAILMAPLCVHAQKQVFGPHTINDGRSILRDEGHQSLSKRSNTPWEALFDLYKETTYPYDAEYRTVLQWNIPNDSIVQNTTISYVKVRMEYSCDTSLTMNARLFVFDQPVQNLNDDDAWSVMSGDGLCELNGSDMIVDQVFDSSSTFVAAIQNALASNFLSIGLRLSSEQAWFALDSVTISLEIGFTAPSIQVIISNVVDNIVNWTRYDSLSAGNESRVRDEKLTSGFHSAPDTVSWTYSQTPGINHYPESRFHQYLNLTGGNKQKFGYWDGVTSSYFIKKNVNNFDGSKTSFLAFMDNHKSTNLHSKMELDYQYALPVGFWDPWNVKVKTNTQQVQSDTWITHTTPYAPHNDNQSYGVFINKNPEQNKPYYSVRASRYLTFYDDEINGGMRYRHKNVSSLPLNEGDGIFLGWERSSPSDVALNNDSSKSAVDYVNQSAVFTNDTSTITAVYKAHMLAVNGEIQPTEYNNQRKILIDKNGAYHAVYESVNEIWYTKSVDSGASWSPEELVSGLQGGCAVPCISEYDGDFAIVYRY